MRFLLTLLLVFSLSSPVHAQTPSEAEPNVEDLLISANSKKALAAREIAQSPNRVAGELARVMAGMDRLFQEQVQERFDAHYKKVEQSLQTVSLPEDVGSLEVVWQQAKAGVYDSSDLDALLEGFIRRAQTTLEPQQEELAGHIDSQFKETLTAELKQAQDTIRAPFQEVLAGYFPAWDVPYLNPPPVPKLPGLQEEDRTHVPGSVVVGFAGLGVYGGIVFSKGILTKAVPKIAAMTTWLRRKILGKVAAQVVRTGAKAARAAAAGGGPTPTGIALGTIMTIWTIWGAYDAWNATQAKADLENALRTQFLSTYKEEFSPVTIWNQPVEEGEPSTRQQLEQQVSASLHTWSEHCRKEVERMLDAARVFALSPNVQNYIAEQTQTGRHTQEIVEDMHLVGEVFGPEIIVQAPIGNLLTMLVHAPDRQELARLARELDSWLLQEYTEHGREVLVAAHLLGVPTFLEVVQAGKKLDWSDVRAMFERYPRDLSEPARRGLVLALQEQTAPSGVAPTTLETIARHQSLFRLVAPLVVPDTEKLFRLFGSLSVVELVDQALQKNAEAAQAFLSQWSVRTWERYRDPARFDALLSVAAYRLTERRQAADAFAREIGERDELTPVFVDVGLCGVQLWDAYVGTASGQHQRQEADEAIRFYKAGYPCDALLTREGLQQARFDDFLPFGLGRKLRSLGTLAYYGLIVLVVSPIVLVVLVIAVPAVRWVRKLLMGGRSSSPAGEPASGRPRPVETSVAGEVEASSSELETAQPLSPSPPRQSTDEPSGKSEAEQAQPEEGGAGGAAKPSGKPETN